MPKRKPINIGVRESGFFTLKDLKLEVEMGRTYLQTDTPQSLLLYRIDYKKTKVHALYGESRATEKVALPPVEIRVRFNVEENKSEYLGNSILAKQWGGKLIFTVYNDELEEKNVDINRGDYVGLRDANNNLRFYEIYENDKVNIGNDKTIAGIESYYRKIEAVAVDTDVFVSTYGKQY